MANLEKECKWHFAEHLGGREDGPYGGAYTTQ